MPINLQKAANNRGLYALSQICDRADESYYKVLLNMLYFCWYKLNIPNNLSGKEVLT